MPLQNFGSILNFAEELESQDQQFYMAAAGNPCCATHKRLFTELAEEAEKSVKTVQRIRRENVTEMILETVRDFTRASYCEACEEVTALTVEEVLKIAKRLEARAARYYSEAAEKINALPEVSRALKSIEKNRKMRLVKLMSAGP